MFNYEVAEMFEFGMENYLGTMDVPSKKPMPQCKPMLLFLGDGFANDADMRIMKSVFMDIFKGREYSKLNKDAL